MRSLPQSHLGARINVFTNCSAVHKEVTDLTSPNLLAHGNGFILFSEESLSKVKISYKECILIDLFIQSAKFGLNIHEAIQPLSADCGSRHESHLPRASCYVT